MANPRGIVSTQDLADLFRSYLASFGPMAEAPDAIEEELARVIMGDGTEVKIPFMPVSNAPKVRNPGDERGATEASEEYTCVVQHQPIYPDSDRQLYDNVMSSPLQMSLWSDKLAEMIMTAPGVWRELLAETMNKARVGTLKSYNGSNFFSTTHPISPVKAIGVQSNYLPNTKMDKAGAIAMMKLIHNMKGHDGRRLNRRMRNLVLAVPNEDLQVQAAEVWTADMIAQAIGANAAVAIKNQLARYNVRIKLFPELDDHSSKACYLLDLSSPTQRAFVVSKARNITPYYSGLSPSDEVRRKYLSVEAGYDAYGGAGVMLHQKGVCLEIP